MARLEGRSALVTGAGGGIGRAVALRLAREGAAVLATDIEADAAEETAALIRGEGGVAESAVVDVVNRSHADAAAARAAGLAGGTLHILVNNAGIIRPAMFPKLSEDDFRRVLDVHVVGAYTMSQAALPLLPDDGTGRIINVTSAAGLVGTIGQANYGAAKAAVVGLTKSLAKELARRSITVNAIAPLAATAMTQNIREHEKLAAQTLARIPLGRWAEPDEIAGTFAFFASDDAAYITGQVLPVDGGTVI
jgi:3-oxoacyl-[acyl-carrier protein] reductase